MGVAMYRRKCVQATACCMILMLWRLCLLNGRR